MRVRGLPVVACALFTPWVVLAQTGGPVEAAVKFHQAQQAGRCAEVWSLYSRDTQERIREQARRLARERGVPFEAQSAESSHCSRFGKVKPGTARLVRQVGPEAVVSATFRGAVPRHELDFGAHFSEYAVELDLVREDGAWKAELPRRKIQSSQARLSVPAGVVDWRKDPVEGGIHHKLAVKVASRVPREALEAVLRDPRAWAVALPSLRSVEALPRAGERERALLSFAESPTPLPVTVRLLGASVEWTSEGGAEAPVYMSGAWTLEPNADGTTLVGLTLVLNPRHWPRYERQFAATRMAKALDTFQTAAGKKP